ncbi:MAG: (2Fe-2S)-binding protein [Anaerolineales bacterium]
MNINVNGQIYTVPDAPERLLLWVLRDELGLIGTKFGCGAGLCGSCTIHVEGVATRACITPLTSVANKAIRTIEGLAERQTDGSLKLHPVQQAWLDEQVPQCSWCQPGQMMTAAAFLSTTPHPTEEQVIQAMSQNYCRCGCYGRIKRAVLKAAEQMV